MPSTSDRTTSRSRSSPSRDFPERLLDFIPFLSPEYKSPYHLAPLVDLLERMDREPIRGLSSVSTRHGKTTTIGHAIVRMLKKNPRKDIIYFSFGAEFSYKQNREFRRLAQEAGIELSKDFSTIKEWRTPEGGGVFACSRDQDVIGRGADAIIVDDPLGSPEDADDPDIRDDADKKIRFLTTRLHPGGSVLVNMSRFHPDDPIGRRERDDVIRWEHVKMPAILDAGFDTQRALWPERWSLTELCKLRRELEVDDPAERTWWAQYMGEPLPESNNLFSPPARYSELPGWNGHRDAIGIDMAFSTGKTADWFALTAARAWSDTMYLRNVVRFKADMSMLESNIRAFWDMFGHCPIFSYVSGPEIGAIHYLASRGIPVLAMHARYNKLVRSQKTRDRWNTGKILLPTHAPWIPGFLSRVASFRGHDKDQDDEIDALVSMHDGSIGSGVTTPKTLGRPRF